MKYLELALGNKAILDDEDYPLVSKHKWQLMKNGYVRRTIKIDGKHKTLLLHRFILNETNRGVWIDHINQNKLDCRKCNLRICTPSQNKQNIGVRSHNVSRLKGVELMSDGIYQARIGINGKMIYLGRFLNPLKAAEAYNNEAKKLFGEFACLNTI